MKLLKVNIIIFFLFIPWQLFSQNIDIELLRAINTPYELQSDKFFRFVSNSDLYIVAGIPVAMGTAGLIKKDESLVRNACVTAGATLVNMGITAILKYSINRDRPYITYPDIMQKTDVVSSTASFPSGHTSTAFATATSVSLEYPKWYVIVPLFGWAGTVGYSRMHLGVHYPSDVLAGAAIGAGSAWLTHFVNKKLILKSRKKPAV